MNYVTASTGDVDPVGTLTIRALIISIKPGATITVSKRSILASSHKGITLGTARDYVNAHKDALKLENMNSDDYWYEWVADPVAIA